MRVEVSLQVKYVPMPPSHIPAWRAGLRQLLDLIQEIDLEKSEELMNKEKSTINCEVPND